MKKILILGLLGAMILSCAPKADSKTIEPSSTQEEKLEVVITGVKQFDELVKTSDLVLVDFHATWCAPCRLMGPVLKQLKKEKSSLTVAKVDVDKNMELSGRYSIRAIPTVMLFKNGKKVWEHTGLTTVAELRKYVEKYE